jgi:transposase
VSGVYTLKEWIDKQAAKTGAAVEKITDKVTQTCHKCSAIAEKRMYSAQYFTCKSCASELELDVNAAINCRKLASDEVTPKK